MALDSSALSTVLSRMMEWGFDSMLGPAERRCLRLVCRELRQPVAEHIDTLVVRMDSSACRDPATAAAMARFHRSRRAAKHLHLYVAAGNSVRSPRQRLATYLAGISGAGSALRAVQHFHLHISLVCPGQLKHLLRLLQALPALQGMSVQVDEACACCTAAAHAQMLSALVGCKHLHTLALGSALRQDEMEVLHMAAQAQRMHTFSINWIETGYLWSLRSLPLLECLCVKGLGVVNIGLPRIRTLCSAAISVTHMDGRATPAWHPRMQCKADVRALEALPALQRLCGVTLVAEGHTLTLSHHAVQRFASCAESWALHVDVTSSPCACLSRDVPAGSLPALVHLQVLGQLLPSVYAERLACLLAAAPHVAGLCLQLPEADGCCMPVSGLPTLLAPLRHAAHLHTLWLCVSGSAGADTRAAVLAAAAAYLTQPMTGQGGEGGTAGCPSVRRVCVSGAELADWPVKLQRVL